MGTDKLMALAFFGFDYHSGGGSRLYRVASMAAHILNLRGVQWYNRERLTAKQQAIYRQLEAKWANDERPGYRPNRRTA